MSKAGRKKLDLTEEEKKAREDRIRASKREYARRKREEKNGVAQPPDVTAQFFGGQPIVCLPKQTDIKVDSEPGGETHKINEANELVEGLSITPFDNSLVDSLKDRLASLTSFFKSSTTEVEEDTEVPTEHTTKPKAEKKSQKLNLNPIVPPSTVLSVDERQALIGEYVSMITSGVDPEKIQVSDNIRKIVKELQDSDINDIRIRVSLARKHLYRGIDNQLSEKTLDIACMLAGKALKCYDELKADVEGDEYLKNLTSNFLSTTILNKMPDTVKIGGLFASHVLKAKLSKLQVLGGSVDKQPNHQNETRIESQTEKKECLPREDKVIEPVLVPNVKIPPHLTPLVRKT